jgi:hypothetical protein
MISSSLASSSVIMDDEMIDALATTPLEQTHLSSSPTHPTNNSNNSNNNSNSISNGSNNVEEEDGRHDLSDAQLTLRRQILSIHADPQLTQAEKAKRMQVSVCVVDDDNC